MRSPPSAVGALSCFSSPARAAPCRLPRRMASNTSRHSPGLPGWCPSTLFKNEKPQFVADVSRVLRGAAEYLGTLPAVLVPLAHMRNPIGVLVIGCDALPSPGQMVQAASVGHALTLALDRARTTSQGDLQAELRELLQAFSRDVSLTTLGRRPGDALQWREPALRRRSHIRLAPRSPLRGDRAFGLVRRLLPHGGTAHPDIGRAAARGGPAKRSRRNYRHRQQTSAEVTRRQ